MTYAVEKIAADRWQIMSPFGDNLGVERTRKAAVAIARMLAGWRGSVVVRSR